MVAGLGTGAVLGALDELNGLYVARLDLGAVPAILSKPNELSVARLVLGVVLAILSPPNGLSVVGFDVGAVSSILSTLNWLASAVLGVEDVSAMLRTPNGLVVAGLGVGAVPKSIGRVEAPEVLDFCSGLLSVPVTPKRGRLLVWLLLGAVKKLLGGVLVVFGLAAAALGPPNRLVGSSVLAMALLAPVAVSSTPMVLNVVAVLLLPSLAVFEVVVAVLAIISPTGFSPRVRGFVLLWSAAPIPSTGL